MGVIPGLTIISQKGSRSLTLCVNFCKRKATKTNTQRKKYAKVIN